ncbi:MAG: shikimate dehydrogenase [Caldilineaceae bacterium]|nr:shikimate dehydrogenase [Caldilineaceae bacterium]
MTTTPITGKTAIVGLIGWPTGHSVSPNMHNAAFAALGLDWRYVPLPVATEPNARIGEAVAGVRALGLRGVNVTVPHKQAVMPHLDELSAAALVIGAVNTIIVQPDGRLLGDNTDAPGFIADLRDHNVDPKDKRVLILGAGGSARAVVYGLATAGASSITVANRTRERANELSATLQTHVPNCPLRACAFPDDLQAVAAESDLIINCTSLGMTPNVDTLPWLPELPFQPDQVVYDLVYNPRQTRLLAQAARDGAQTIGGIGMLVWQGAIAFERWTGVTPPVDVMRQAIGAIKG